ncbi:MAG: type 1 glutamine amidotransferase domain-containing protein [Alphaproteobacteria bacterium]|nr:type 1 glutamine amidotransferase domain-containing protein [Alphaproteobacteria bacterium]
MGWETMDRRRVLMGAAALAGSGFLAGGAAAGAGAARGRALMVLTSTGVVPGSDRPTGLWWSEYSEPLALFLEAGLTVDVASIKGGPVPVDPRSGGAARAKRDADAWARARDSLPIERVAERAYDALFLPGGHGTMWDFPDHPVLTRLVGEAAARGAPVGSVCHGPAGLIGARTPDGRPLVAGRRVNGFTNDEERAAGMDAVVPFLLQDRLVALGGRFEHGGVFQRFAVRDGAVICGQNPASSKAAAGLMLEALGDAQAADG